MERADRSETSTEDPRRAADDGGASRADLDDSSSFARSSSSASNYSRDRVGSKVSIASSSAGNRGSMVVGEAATLEEEEETLETDDNNTPARERRRHAQESDDVSFSRSQLELAPSKLAAADDFEFLRKATHCQHKQMIIENMNRILSNEGVVPIRSPPFVLEKGYRLCLQVAFKGNMSVGLRVMKGERDKQLTWPFNMIVIFRLKNQHGNRSLVKMFRCDKNGSRLKDCLSRPTKSDMNVAIGFPCFFISQHNLCSDGFVKDDSMHLDCYIFPKDAKVGIPSDYLYPSSL